MKRLPCRYLYILICIILAGIPAGAVDMTPDLLFRQLEERTEQVFSLVANVRLSSSCGTAFARLSIQSPDKFEMDINDGEFRVLFDGERLWIYISRLNEVMTLDTAGSGGFMSEALRQWVNPREIVTKITRKTMFTFFDIEMDVPPASGGWRMMFNPRAGGIWRRLFDVGTYGMDFASGTRLPTRVIEYAPDGAERGTLDVLGYTFNEQLPKERFVYEPASGVVQVPISKVLVDKLDDGKQYVIDHIGSWMGEIKKSFSEWGF